MSRGRSAQRAAAEDAPVAPKASPWNLGNILGLLALLATIAFGIIPLIVSSAQQRLRLDATIQSAAQIVGSTLPSQVRVTVGGKEARNVYATVLKVANSGARPITPDLFAPGTVLRLRLGDQCEVVEQRVVGARPQDVRERARVTVIPGGVALAPLLLNPDDTVLIQVLTSNCRPQLVPSASIAGITQVSMRDAAKIKAEWAYRWLIVFAIVMGGIFSLLNIYEAQIKKMSRWQRQLIVFGLLALMISALFFLMNMMLSSAFQSFSPTYQ